MFAWPEGRSAKWRRNSAMSTPDTRRGRRPSSPRSAPGSATKIGVWGVEFRMVIAKAPAIGAGTENGRRNVMGVKQALLAVIALGTGVPALAGEYNLVIDEKTVNITGRDRTALTINGAVPGPAPRWREGEDVTLRVTNRLEESTSIHWHGVIVPNSMDGVPGISFEHIHPGGTFTYRFTVAQSGTYWYHSHSGLQEQAGMYSPLLIEPSTPEPFQYDREYVVMLS